MSLADMVREVGKHTNLNIRELLWSIPTTPLGIAKRFLVMPPKVVRTIELSKRLKAFDELMKDDFTKKLEYKIKLCLLGHKGSRI